MAIKLMKRHSVSGRKARERILVFHPSEEQTLKILIVSEWVLSGRQYTCPSVQ